MRVVALVLAFNCAALGAPAVAHERGDLAVFSWPRHTGGVYVLHASTAAKRKVASKTPYYINNSTRVAWSPDRSKLAFEAGSEQREDIFVWSRRSGRVRRVTAQSGREVHPSWAPGGRRIVYVHESNTGRDLFVVRADGSGRQRLTQDDAYVETPEWSPDGSTIAYGTTAGLFLIRPNGTAKRRLTSDRFFDYQPSWAPGSQRLVFSRIRTAPSAFLVVINKDGSNRRRIIDSRGRDEEAEWAPDGSRIAFSHSTSDEQDGKIFVYSVRPDGLGLRRLTPDLTAEGQAATGVFPEWSPGSKRIAYLRRQIEADEREPEVNIWVMRRDGSHQRNLTPKAGPGGFFGLDW